MGDQPGSPEVKPALGDAGTNHERDAASVKLDSVRDEDLPRLCEWMNDIEELHLWTTRRMPRLYEDLAKHIQERCRSGLFTVIRNSKTGEPIGFIDGTMRERHGVAELEVYVPPKWRLRGVLIGVALFVSHLFTSYELRKIYCQTYAYNSAIIKVLRASGFVEEGCFKEFVWWKDRHWDMLVYSLDRDTFEAIQHGEDRLGRLRLVARQLRKWSD